MGPEFVYIHEFDWPSNEASSRLGHDLRRSTPIAACRTTDPKHADRPKHLTSWAALGSAHRCIGAGLVTTSTGHRHGRWPGWNVSRRSSPSVISSLVHYQRFGFDVRAYTAGGYGFASWHGIEIHLGVVAEGEHRAGAPYLFVEDADRLAAQWPARPAPTCTRQKTPTGASTRAPLLIRTATSSVGSPIG